LLVGMGLPESGEGERKRHRAQMDAVRAHHFVHNDAQIDLVRQDVGNRLPSLSTREVVRPGQFVSRFPRRAVLYP
jgi:hypothetical protein